MAVDITDLGLYPVPSNNIFVLQGNAITIDNVVNGTAYSYVNRAGETVISLAGFTNLYDQFNASSSLALSDFNSSSSLAISDFETESSESLEQFNDDADAALLRIAAFENTGTWVAENPYTVNQIWQNPTDLSWYLVLSNYTSSTDVQDDIDGGNVALFAGTTYDSSYSFVNTVLGDKITYGEEFDDSNAFDRLLGSVYDGTATVAEQALAAKVNLQLGILAGS